MYDFMVFGYFAGAIGETFFPAGDQFASLMLSLMTFGVGFLMRPIGALVLGAYIDRHGRRAGLILTLALMSVGTFGLAFMPGFAPPSFGYASSQCIVVITRGLPQDVLPKQVEHQNSTGAKFQMPQKVRLVQVSSGMRAVDQMSSFQWV